MEKGDKSARQRTERADDAGSSCCCLDAAAATDQPTPREKASTYINQVLPVFNQMFSKNSNARTFMSSIDVDVTSGMNVSYQILRSVGSTTDFVYNELKPVVVEYTVICGTGVEFTPESILGALHDKALDKHTKYRYNFKQWCKVEEVINQLFRNMHFTNNKWQYQIPLSVPEVENVLDDGTLDDNCESSPSQLLELSTSLQKALHHTVEMGNTTGRNVVCELLQAVAKCINLQNVLNHGGGAPSSFSVRLDAGYVDPDITWTHAGQLEHVVLYQVEIKKGPYLRKADRRQLHRQMIRTLVGQSQVFGMLICSAKAELYFTHRATSADTSQIYLFQLNEYELSNQQEFLSLLTDIRKSVVYQACALVIDPLHLKKAHAPT